MPKRFVLLTVMVIAGCAVVPEPAATGEQSRMAPEWHLFDQHDSVVIFADANSMRRSSESAQAMFRLYSLDHDRHLHATAQVEEIACQLQIERIPDGRIENLGAPEQSIDVDNAWRNRWVHTYDRLCKGGFNIRDPNTLVEDPQVYVLSLPTPPPEPPGVMIGGSSPGYGNWIKAHCTLPNRRSGQESVVGVWAPKDESDTDIWVIVKADGSPTTVELGSAANIRAAELAMRLGSQLKCDAKPPYNVWYSELRHISADGSSTRTWWLATLALISTTFSDQYSTPYGSAFFRD